MRQGDIMSMQRRSLLLGAATGASLFATGLRAQPGAATTATAAPPIPKLRIVIPANAGGGWDLTGRTLGEALVAAGQVGSIEYENKGGKGGVVGLQHVVERYAGDPSTLMVGGFVMVGSIALNQPPHDLARMEPIARLTTELPVLVVKADSPYADLKAFAAAFRTRPSEVSIAGGGAGGIDHMCAGMMARAIGINPTALVYKPYSSGSEVLAAVTKGDVAAAISGYGELKQGLASGKLRALGIASRRSAYGVPAMSEQGINVELGNWRGVFAPTGLPPARVAQLRDAVQVATQHATWKAALTRNNWQAAWLAGPGLRDAIEVDQAIAGVLVRLLQLKPS
jgi:putative tricarboxylic transport membrane protein